MFFIIIKKSLCYVFVGYNQKKVCYATDSGGSCLD